MQATTHAPSISSSRLWTGRVLGGLPTLFLLFDGIIKLLQLAPVKAAHERLGYPAHLAVGIGILELICTVLYLVPRTTVLGAVLLTGYLGGATATLVRVGDPFFFPLIVGALIWAGLLLRDERLRGLVSPRG